jgi:hypothetical protein
MKKCSKCGKNKEFSEFHPKAKNSGGYRAACKVCHRRLNNERHHKRKDNCFLVYYLPEEHYIGFTQNKSRRFSQHRANGKCTDGYEIVAMFDNPFDAIILEAEFHRRGYNGFTYKR